MHWSSLPPISPDGSGPVGNGLSPVDEIVARATDDDVAPVVAPQRVIPRSTGDPIDARAREDGVVTGIAHHLIVAAHAEELIVSQPAHQVVVTAEAGQQVVTGSPDQPVV